MSNIQLYQSGSSRAVSRQTGRTLARIEGGTSIDIARVEARADVQTAQIDAVAAVAQRAMQGVAFLSQMEGQLGQAVPLAVSRLQAVGAIAVRVVSMPSTSAFDRQPRAWQERVLPPGVPRVAIEMGVSDGWWKYGCAAVIGIDRYGESAPGPVLFEHFGFTVANVVATVRTVLSSPRKAP